jgi:large subunit ribosomal protein L15
MKLKKRRKVTRMHGKGMGTHGWGARKKHLGSGHRGGCGMGGTGKMGGAKKTMVLKLYGAEYFGKQGVTSRGTRRVNNRVINLDLLEKNLENLKKKFGDKDGTLNLAGYKILGKGEIKTKLTIKALSASESAKAKIEKAGGKLILTELVEKVSEETKEEPKAKK